MKSVASYVSFLDLLLLLGGWEAVRSGNLALKQHSRVTEERSMQSRRGTTQGYAQWWNHTLANTSAHCNTL